MSAPLLHIGYPKALSSWLQKHLFKPQYGFYTAMDPIGVQLDIIEASAFGFTEQNARIRFEQNSAQYQNPESLVPVVTSEALVGNAPCGGYNAKTNADRLFQLYPNGKVLIVIREQKSAIRSLYKTFVVWGLPHSINKLLNPPDHRSAPVFNLDFLRYDLLVSYYQSLFGKERVLVLPYEAFSVQPQKFIQSILSFSELEAPPEVISKLPFKQVVNGNQPLIEILIQRWLNYFLLSNAFNYSGLLTTNEQRTQKRLTRSKKRFTPRFSHNWFEQSFKEQVHHHCHGAFADSNRRLEALTGLDLQEYRYEL